jgi:DNA modification methylase
MRTTHRLIIGDARDLGAIPDGSVQLVVTSPPYPMIAMWDACFSAMDPAVVPLLAAEDGLGAFEAMHRCLDAVWAECWRVLAPGGIAAINIGDATRNLAGRFRLYPNHARIVTTMAAQGFDVLPDILWRKPTNAPNKFMGSGMLPAGAYVTYEHEYVLLFRRGDKRAFGSADEKAARQRSAFFWEERNSWFSDLWSDLRGTRQALGEKGDRERSAAYPFELPFRLINMYSLAGDTVLDPFAGTGTTLAAAAVAGRSSLGVELSDSFAPVVLQALEAVLPQGADIQRERLDAHRRFVGQRQRAGKPIKHHNLPHDLPVITGQERQLELLAPQRWERLDELSLAVEHTHAERAQPPAPGQQSLL